MSDERGVWGIINAVGERSVPVSDYVRNYMVWSVPDYLTVCS
jgi:hypothetical protein